MTSNRHELFRQLEPPPGGPERFARRLDEATSATLVPRRRALVFASMACAALALVVAVIVFRDARDSSSSATAESPLVANLYDAPEFDRLLGRPTPPTPLTITRNDQAAKVTEIETANQKVRLYQID